MARMSPPRTPSDLMTTGSQFSPWPSSNSRSGSPATNRLHTQKDRHGIAGSNDSMSDILLASPERQSTSRSQTRDRHGVSRSNDGMGDTLLPSPEKQSKLLADYSKKLKPREQTSGRLDAGAGVFPLQPESPHTPTRSNTVGSALILSSVGADWSSDARSRDAERRKQRRQPKRWRL